MHACSRIDRTMQVITLVLNCMVLVPRGIATRCLINYSSTGRAKQHHYAWMDVCASAQLITLHCSLDLNYMCMGSFNTCVCGDNLLLLSMSYSDMHAP